jgi:glyoxylase-like metal-dependent hydrolase (beta-lactamase superfamily II)
MRILAMLFISRILGTVRRNAVHAEFRIRCGFWSRATEIQLHHFEKLRDAHIVKLNGDYDAFGDGSVIIKSTPGHTPGHQSHFVRLSRIGPVLLAGDVK